MDDFTQKMVERARARRQKLNNQRTQASRLMMPSQENASASFEIENSASVKNSPTFLSHNQSRPTAPLQESNALNVALSSTAKSKLQQLGNLYSDNSPKLTSPIHRAEDKILEEAPAPTFGKSKCRLNRLNELASTINNWEDDLSHPDYKKKVDEVKPSKIAKTDSAKVTTTTEPGVTKFTKTESKLTETTVSTTITMKTINKKSGIDEINKSTVTIVAGTGESNPRKKKGGDEDSNLGEKIPRLTGVTLKDKIVESQRKLQKTPVTDKTAENIFDSSESADSSRKTPIRTSTFKKTTPACSQKKAQAPPPPTMSLKKAAPAPPAAPLNTPKKYVAPQPPLTKTASPTKTPSKPSSPFKKSNASPKMGVSALDQKESSVLKRAAMFEKQHNSPLKSKDPAELSLAERKALFEKNKGEILLPKVAFATPLPAKLRTSPAKISKINLPPKVPVSSHVVKNKGIYSLKEKFEKDLVETTNANMSKLEREKELEILKSRWNRNKDNIEQSVTSPVPPPMPKAALSPVKYFGEPTPALSPTKSSVQPKLSVSPTKSFSITSPALSPTKSVKAQRTPEPYKDSPEALKAVQGVKKIVLSPPQSGSLYPNLNDIEVEEESDDASAASSLNNSQNSNIYLNMSFGDILEASKNNPMTPPQGTRENAVLTEMNELLDAALGDVSCSDDDEYDESTPPKTSRKADYGVAASNSFEYESESSMKAPTTPLIHTVSFYRKQQNCMSTPNNTPMQVIKRNEVIESNDEIEDESADVQKKIAQLMLEVTKEQTLISQASNALTHCMAKVEFLGSAEQVESERVLLLSGHKRRACLNEIDRLKVEGTLRPKVSNSNQLRDQGDLIISKISIPLKRDALHAMAADESMLYFVFLIKCEERVIASPVISASSQNLKGTTLSVTGEFRLDKLYCDFKASVEVYYMALNRELLPHHIKYHLNGKKEKRLLTPMKSKKSQSRLAVPTIQSPAGPNAVHTTNFQLGGYVVFSLKELKRTQWTLNQVPYTSPLEGSINMKISSSLKLDNEMRGFLSMFDDVSGYGAWHRRWCRLSDHTISYWRYPDDENNKVPLGSIDLRSVVTETVGPVARDICARLHSFLLESTRPSEPHDTKSLILVLDGDIARIRHILSADTKELRIEWCARINKTLALMRAWNCHL